LLGLLGRPDLSDDDVRRLQALLVECGARGEVEQAIERLVDQALVALAAAPIAPEARGALEELGTYVAWRDR
jgi:geranylgeranyl pyrophosphate synthase